MVVGVAVIAVVGGLSELCVRGKSRIPPGFARESNQKDQAERRRLPYEVGGCQRRKCSAIMYRPRSDKGQPSLSLAWLLRVVPRSCSALSSPHRTR